MIIFWSGEYFLFKEKNNIVFKPLAHDSFVGSTMHVLVNLCGGKRRVLDIYENKKTYVYISLAINESSVCFGMKYSLTYSLPSPER